MLRKLIVGVLMFSLVLLGGCSTKVGVRPYNDPAGQYSFNYPNGMIQVQAPKRDGAPVVVMRDLVYEDEGVNLMVAGGYDQTDSIAQLGTLQEVGQRVIDKFLAPPGSNRAATLLNGGEIDQDGQTYYVLEYSSQIGQQPRHDVVTVTIHNHRLYTLTASTSEQRWSQADDAFYEVAKSFHVG